MKHYDFEAVQPRRGTGSMKWAEMEKYDCPEGVIPFSVADMELKVMPEVVDGLKEFLDKSPLGYCNPDERFNAAVCRWERDRHGWDIRPEWLLGAPGVINAFFTAVHAFTAPGDGVLLLTPVYYPMYMAATRNDRQVVGSALINTNGYYTIDFADLEAKAKRPDVKLMILCSPHNPCGRVWTREELEHIGRICLENNVVLFSDEIHSDLILPGYHHTPIGSLSDELAQNTLTAISPSKTFSLAGLQTSSVIVPNEALRKAFDEELKRHDGNPKCNILGLEACRIAYTEGDEWLDQLISILEENRRLIVEYLRREFPSVIVSPLEGTYLLWMDFRPLDIPADKLAELLRREAFLFFDDGIVFGEAGRGFERWNLACPTSYITPALERLGKAPRAHADKR